MATGRGRLLGLDRRLDREGEAAVETQAVVEHGAHERGQRAADAMSAAVDEVLPGEAVDVGAEPRLVELGGRLAERDQPVGDALDVDLLDRVDEAEEVDPLRPR